MGLVADDFTFSSHDGLALFGQKWQPDSIPTRGQLIIVHGIGEHSSRYESIIEKMLPIGISVHSWDQRGHGRSVGRRGHVRSWGQYRRDLQDFMALTRSETHESCPQFILGHSMGALVVLDAAVSDGLAPNGIILSGAPVEPTGVAKPHLVLLARLLSKIWPTFAVKLPIQGDQLTSEPSKLERLEADPLLHRTITVRWGTEALAAVDRVRHHPQRLTIPLLIMHGIHDLVNHHRGARWLYENAASQEKTLRLYEETRHEPHNDVESDTATQDLADWIDARIRLDSDHAA